MNEPFDVEKVKAAMGRALQEIEPQVTAMAHVMAIELLEGDSMTQDQELVFEAGTHAGAVCMLQVITRRGWLDLQALRREVEDPK